MTHGPQGGCDQIDILDVARRRADASSRAAGRTTCSYFLPGDKEIIFASTHEDSPECPTPPDHSNGYVWRLFEFDIYNANPDGSNLANLARAGLRRRGDRVRERRAIIFTSTRSGDLELWPMDADGENLHQLTNTSPATTAARSSPRTARRSCGARAAPPTRPTRGSVLRPRGQGPGAPDQLRSWSRTPTAATPCSSPTIGKANFAPYFYARRPSLSSRATLGDEKAAPSRSVTRRPRRQSELEQITHDPGSGFDAFRCSRTTGKDRVLEQSQRQRPARDERVRRGLGAVPVAGKYRLIDIPVSNCINSGLNRISMC